MTFDAYHRAFRPGNTRWMLDALCAESDPEMFFVDKGGNPRPAIEICRRCPVRVACLEFALEHHMGYGVWGGMTAHARRDLKRAMPVGAARPEWECVNGHDTRELGRLPSGKCRACNREQTRRWSA